LNVVVDAQTGSKTAPLWENKKKNLENKNATKVIKPKMGHSSLDISKR
jgi:hypothetical protein